MGDGGGGVTIASEIRDTLEMDLISDCANKSFYWLIKKRFSEADNNLIRKILGGCKVAFFLAVHLLPRLPKKEIKRPPTHFGELSYRVHQ